ncbi:GNAT family N-acetyltransferase [Asticcacaulis sp. EMRT-3]|uniref:GNAT family N-acetyltransferase n=1 Tax=Asticcacaulis sp. EMRT-3 TaxID=3040349 RepID=UPI0024AF555C|nr:GNAT family N-acetyltransferase [Asticcacaulis sp. EMRT-3]MDI7774163.1 GNAT family N-acetyltransferase [Asticcacaulis sp. EMRT-3]
MRIVMAKQDDKAAWWPLWQAYLAFYENPLPDDLSELTFARCLDPASGMELRLAKQDGETVGFALCVYHPSSWSRSGYCYLEDLYVTEAARGQGVGRALIEAVAAGASERGAEKLYWQTHEHNATARALYDQVATKTDFVSYMRPLLASGPS